MWYKQYYQAWEFDPTEIRDLHIMELEGFALVVWLEYLVRVHPDEISGKRYIIRCDNDPFVVAVNSRKSTQPAIALLIGIIHHWSALYHFDLRLVYIKSADNIAADALSRGDRLRFLQAASDSGFPPSSLVFLQMPSRSALVSKMISAKSSAQSMLPQR